MKESFWGTYIIIFAVVCISVIFFFQSLTNNTERMYTDVKEVTEAAMIDSLDLANYRMKDEIRIDREKFVENFLRRFAENASLTKTYKISIYDISEKPPKVSLKVSTKDSSVVNYGTDDGTVEYTITDRIDAILETTY